jgi:hypothetical protein
LQTGKDNELELSEEDLKNRMLVSAVFWAFGIPADAYRLGVTRVFFNAVSTIEGGGPGGGG